MRRLAFLSDILPADAGDRGVLVIALSQFGIAFCFTVVMSFMPFYIIKVSTYSEHETMIWIGMIMGFQSFISAASAPYWGSLTAKYSPKALFEIPFLANAIVFLLMGFTDNLPLLLALRIMQGFLGAASTIGIVMILQLSREDRLGDNVSLFQNAITVGQLLGPPVGAYLAAHLGYRSPFVFSFLLVGVCLVLCHITVADVQKRGKDDKPKITFDRGLLWGWVLCFLATTYLAFMPSVLPHILEGFGLVGEGAVKSAGFIMMAYTASAIIGNYIINRMTTAATRKRMIAATCLAAALLQLLFSVSHGIISFSIIRMLQTGFIAAVLPMVLADLASQLGGTGIGILNSARFAGNGFGPLVATSVVAYSNLLTLYVLIAGLTVAAVWGYWTMNEGKTGASLPEERKQGGGSDR
jgi:MFS transporter, DHA1 family, multidrug resistance protein